MGMAAATLPRVQHQGRRAKRAYRVRAWDTPEDTVEAWIIRAFSNDQARRWAPRMLLWNFGVRATRVHVHLAKGVR